MLWIGGAVLYLIIGLAFTKAFYMLTHDKTETYANESDGIKTFIGCTLFWWVVLIVIIGIAIKDFSELFLHEKVSGAIGRFMDWRG